MRKYLMFLPLLLAGCTAVYVPEPLEIADQAKYAADLAFCQTAGAGHKAKLDLGAIASGAGTGIANNVSGAAVNPLVPVLGGLGGASNALITSLDIMGHASANVFRHCLEEKTHRDGSAVLANPND